MSIHPPELNGSRRTLAPFIVLSSPRMPTTAMRFRFASCALAVALALSGWLPASAWADRVPRSGPRDGGLPASVRRVQRETGGEVLRAQPIERDGREVYRVKVLTPQGRIRVVEDTPELQQQGPVYPRQTPQDYQRQGPQVPQDYQQGPRPYQQAPRQYPRQVPSYPRLPQQQPRYSPSPHDHYPH
jgi:hypothetical protein